jgi:hypothetical protein
MLGKPLKQALIDRRLNTMMYPQNILFSDIRWGISTGNVKSADNNNCLPMMPTPTQGYADQIKIRLLAHRLSEYIRTTPSTRKWARRALTKFILDHDAGEIGDIGVVYDTAKALLRIPGDFFTVDPIQYGAQIAQEAPHSKRFQILRSAPSMDRIKALLPYRKIHPLLEEFLVSLADQPGWIASHPRSCLTTEQPLRRPTRGWKSTATMHPPTGWRLVNEWEGTAVAQYQNLAGPLERLLNRAATSLEVIRFGLGLQTDQTDCESLTVLQEGIAKLMQNCEQQQFPGKLRCLLCRLEYTKHKVLLPLPGAGRATGTDLVAAFSKRWMQQLPEGYGTLWNCQDEPSPYRKLGIGRMEVEIPLPKNS